MTRRRAIAGVAVTIGAIVTVLGANRAASTEERATPSTSDASSTAPLAAVSASAAAERPALPDRGPHPELIDIASWLQSDVTSLEELRGKVVAVQFWTFSCNNSQATLPHMRELYDNYRDQGFEIVGIHAPEFGFEADEANVVEAAADLDIPWPIALDPTKHTFHAWQEGSTAYWPRIYLLDRQGHIRYDHIGEGRYDEIDAAVRALLAEAT